MTDLAQADKLLDSWFKDHEQGQCHVDCSFCEELRNGGKSHRAEYRRIAGEKDKARAREQQANRARQAQERKAKVAANGPPLRNFAQRQ